MSGESPREEKAESWNWGSNTEWPFHTDGRDDGEMLAAIRQASWQQLAVCTPLGQQDLSE
jgi:hypothetical protein